MPQDATVDDVVELRAQVAALTARLAALEGERRDVAPASPRSVTRRGLLAAAVAGGAGLVAGQVAAAAPAAAATGQNIVLGATNDGGTSITTVTASTGVNSTPFGVVNPNPNGNSIGLYGRLGAASGLFTGDTGQRAAVVGESQNDTGVAGLSASDFGVFGQSDTGFGVSGRSRTTWGVDGRSVNSTGVSGQSSNGAGVEGYTQNGAFAVYGSSPNAIGVGGYCEGGFAGVRGESASSGPGVRGISEFGHGVHGHSANGVAVRAEAGTDETGQSPGPGTDAVYATAVNGYGVHASGGVAPLRLVPATTKGAPRTGAHQVGELWVDRAGSLFLCTAAGSPGTWKKVTVG